MRKIIYFTMASLDGYIEDENRQLDWVIIDDELHRFVNDRAREIGAFLYGRRMYEMMQAAWPTADANPANPEYILEFSKLWKQTPKIVFSKSLARVEGNARLVRDLTATEMLKLKEQPGQALEVGGAYLAASIQQMGLIDEYQIYIHPVILGNGTPMSSALATPARLHLVETHSFSSGVVFLRYAVHR